MTKISSPVWCSGVVLNLLLFLFGSMPVTAQDAPRIMVTPDNATLLIGDSQKFRAVDQTGRMQHHVTWSISQKSAFDAQVADELVLTARHEGNFKLTAVVNGQPAEAQIRVAAGSSLPQGTAKWSVSEPAGCKMEKIVPAPPNSSGSDFLAQSTCPDGGYVSAYTSDGIQLWRRKVSGPATQLPQGLPAQARYGAMNGSGESTHLQLDSSSVCDQITIGTDQEKARELLKSGNHPFNTETPNGRVWVVEEAGAECRLWFDEKSVLTKKRKTLTAE